MLNRIKGLWKAVEGLSYKQAKDEKLPLFYQRYVPKLNMNILDMRGAISRELKYFYTRVPKAANSTVVASLVFAENGYKMCSLNEADDYKKNFFLHPSQISQQDLSEIEKDYFKFSFVRNPYKRIVSSYIDKVLPINSSQHKLICNRINIDSNKEILFDDFLTYLENGGVADNGHWALQSDLLHLPIEEYNFIGKVENISQDLKYVLSTIFRKQTEIISIQDHATNINNRPLFELNERQKKLIYKVYEVDFNLFQYSKAIN